MGAGELLGALSLAMDLAIGVPFETSLRTCVLAARIATIVGFSDVMEVRRVALLRHLGCTAYAHEGARFAGGDDRELLRSYEGVDVGRRGALTARAITRLARGEPLGRRLAAIARVATHPKARESLVTAQCAQAVALAEDLAMPPGVIVALGQIYERHDGRGSPHAVGGDALAPSARILHVAELVEIYHRLGGRAAAVAEVRRRSGGQLAPEVASAFLAMHEDLWEVLEAPSVWDAYLAGGHAGEPDVGIEDIARAFGRFADLKSPYTLGHSTGVAELAAGAMEDRELAERVRLAGLLHDLGSVGVPNGIWEKRGALNAAEWERVRLHGYFTERILAISPALADLAVMAGSHHERLDGSGYHRGASAPGIDRAVRALAAADAYQAMRQARPYRAALSTDRAADELLASARDGKLCRRAVDAVLGTAGHALPAAPRPAGLTQREVEVLVQVARGRTNKEIASSLGIAVRTTNHHVENIYAKIGVGTRAAAALFAVRNELVTTDAFSS